MASYSVYLMTRSVVALNVLERNITFRCYYIFFVVEIFQRNTIGYYI